MFIKCQCIHDYNNKITEELEQKLGDLVVDFSKIVAYQIRPRSHFGNDTNYNCVVIYTQSQCFWIKMEENEFICNLNNSNSVKQVSIN